MSVIGKKPFIQEVLERLGATRVKALQSLVDNLGEPEVVNLEGLEPSNYGTQIKYIVLVYNKYGQSKRGFLCPYTNGDYGFFSFQSDVEPMESFYIKTSTKQYIPQHEFLTADELRRVIDDCLDTDGQDYPLPCYSVNWNDNVGDFLSKNPISSKAIILDLLGDKYLGQFNGMPSSVQFEFERLGTTSRFYSSLIGIDVTDKTFADIFSNTYQDNYALEKGPLPTYEVNTSDNVVDFLTNNNLWGKPIILHSSQGIFGCFIGCFIWYAQHVVFGFELEQLASRTRYKSPAQGINVSLNLTFADIITSTTYEEEYALKKDITTLYKHTIEATNLVLRDSPSGEGSDIVPASNWFVTIVTNSSTPINTLNGFLSLLDSIIIKNIDFAPSYFALSDSDYAADWYLCQFMYFKSYIMVFYSGHEDEEREINGLLFEPSLLLPYSTVGSITDVVNQL